MPGELAKPLIRLQGKAAKVHTAQDPLRYRTGPETRSLSELELIKDQIIGKSITMDHPTDLISRGGQNVDIVGTVIAAHIDGGILVVDMELDSLERAAEVLDSKELSLGYAAFKDANGAQHGTIVDHLAFVSKARGGSELQTRVDGVEFRLDKLEARFDCFEGSLVELDPQLAHATNMPHNINVSDTHADKELDAKSRNAIAEGSFAVPSTRQLPIEDAEHVRAAMARFDQTHFANEAEKQTAYHKVVAAAHKFGIDPSGFMKEHGPKETKKMDNAELQAEIEKLKLDLHNTQKDLASKDGEIKAHKDAADAAKLEAETVRKEVDEKKARMDADAKDTEDQKVQERVELLTLVNGILPTPADVKLDTKALKCAVVSHVDGDDVSDKSKDWIDGVFSGAVKRHQKLVDAKAAAAKLDAEQKIVADKSVEAVTEALNKRKTEAVTEVTKANTSPEQEAKLKMQRETATAWNFKK